jgi:hypothetical protein
MSKSTVVSPLPGAFRKFHVSLGAGVLLGVILALLIVFLASRVALWAGPEPDSHLLVLYVLVAAPAAIAGGLYGLKSCRQDLVRVDGAGVTVDTPSGLREMSWTDICCIWIAESREGQTQRLRLCCRDGSDVHLFPYLPLDTVRRAVVEYCPKTVVVEVVQRRVNWLNPDLHNAVLASLVAVLTLILWLAR